MKPNLTCPKCGEKIILLPLDGISQNDIDNAPFILARCNSLSCDAGSPTGLLGIKVEIAKRFEML